MAPRYRILDLLILVAIVGIIAGAVRFYIDSPSDRERGEISLWLVTFGFTVALYAIYRFSRTLATRLILLGLAVAGADFWYRVYMVLDLQLEEGPSGLASVAAVLVAAGAASGLLAQWREGTPRPAPLAGPEGEADRTGG